MGRRSRTELLDPAANEIEIFDQYIRRIASNVCHSYLRQKAPERFRLKNNLRYQLTRRSELAIWLGEGETLFCGLADWPREGRSALGAKELLDDIKTRRDTSLGDLVVEIFKEIGVPIELDDLVEIVAALQGIKDPKPESLESGDPDLPLQLADERQQADEWLVIAIINGEEVSSPAATAPEMRFMPLGEQQMRELQSLKKRTKSHLALGVFYARAGMLAEAEREFQAYRNDNPQSLLANKLIRQVRSWR